MNLDNLNKRLALSANLGILIGLVLLIYEIRQNSQLMRAQINMDRATSAIETRINVANGGAIATIQSRLYEEVEGFPMAVGWSTELPPEESQRYRFWVTANLLQLSNDWYQCGEGLVEAETCQREVSDRMLQYFYRFYEFGIDFSRQPQDFINEMQEISRREGLLGINDDGTWN